MTIIAFITLFALIVCIAVLSTRQAQRHSRTPKLDNALFRRNDE